VTEVLKLFGCVNEQCRMFGVLHHDGFNVGAGVRAVRDVAPTNLALAIEHRKVNGSLPPLDVRGCPACCLPLSVVGVVPLVV
jgi:hypothetical protein